MLEYIKPPKEIFFWDDSHIISLSDARKFETKDKEVLFPAAKNWYLIKCKYKDGSKLNIKFENKEDRDLMFKNLQNVLLEKEEKVGNDESTNNG